MNKDNKISKEFLIILGLPGYRIMLFVNGFYEALAIIKKEFKPNEKRLKESSFIPLFLIAKGKI